MMRRVWSFGVLAWALTLVPVLVSAQVPPPPAGGQRQRQELEQRLQAGFGRMIQTRLGLAGEQLRQVQAVMASFQEERRTLNRAQASLRYRLRDPGLQDLGEEEARTMLQEMVDLQQRELDLYKQEQEKLLEVLTPAQLVRFYRLRDDLGQQVQRLRQGRGGGGGPGGMGGISSPLPGVGPGGGFLR